MNENTPVLMEFYTQRIPSERIVVVVKYRVAMQWIARGAVVKISFIDQKLLPQASVIAINKVWQ